MRLNQAQNEAVSYTTGPCLVLAGAGSGKTRVITSKIVNLLKNHQIPPNRICALTFTNKAAGEMRQRVSQEIDREKAARIWISTFHSLGLELIRIEHRALGLPHNFTIFDENDTTRVLREILRNQFPELISDSSEKEALDKAKNLISLWKSKLISPEEVKTNTPYVELYRSYAAYLKACHTVDFEDLIYLSTKLLTSNPELKAKWQNCFQYVLVDEYQDTNETQYQLLKVLVGERQRFTVVGDDDQSIYSWRGARPENLKTLTEDFPNLKVIKLEQNYRSSGRILHCANILIANNPHLYQKTLFSEHPAGEKITILECANEEEEALRVAAEIKGQQFTEKCEWSNFAVLYRSNFQSRNIEKALHEARIPCFVTGGTSFFDLQEIKDIMAYCRLISNLKDNAAFLRIINVPRRGIGEQTLEAISNVAAKGNISNFEACMDQALGQYLHPTQLRAVNDFVSLMTKLRQMLLNHKDAYLAQVLPDLIGYERYLKVGTDSKNAAVEFKMRNVRSFLNWILDLIAGKNGEASLTFAQAVEKLGLKEIRDRKSDEDKEDAVQLMTLHSSKGLEFPYVFLIGTEENILPHKNSLVGDNINQGLQEERRLAYVGVTRAQKKLCISWCKERLSRQDKIKTQISRFITELPQEDLIYVSAKEKKQKSKEERIQDLTEAFMAVKGLSSS